jgi:Ca2+-binding RTX toxin-like protein
MAYIKVINPAGEWVDMLDGVTDGADTIEGNIGGDHIFAGGGDDFIKGGGGADFLSGGEGIDTASYADSGEAVKVNLETNANKGGTAEGDFLIGVENVLGTKFGDKLTGNWADNMLDGGGGDDVLKGGGGADTLKGGTGNDVFQIDGLQDKVYGGADIDTLAFTDGASGKWVDLDGGWVRPSWGPGMFMPPHTFVYDVENVLGTADHDRLHGDGAANKLWGGGGGDDLRGRGGNDMLDGGSGGDFINGGANADILWGGADGDRFVFKQHVDSIFGGGTASMDVVMDFQKGQDKIDLTEMEPGLGNLLILNNQNVDGVNYSYVGLDYDGDGDLTLYEFALMVKMAPGATLSAGDVLI